MQEEEERAETAQAGLAEAPAQFSGTKELVARIEPSGPRKIVAVGASAGGLEPLEALFAAMPHDTGMSFVVVQHLSPDFKSLMDELLVRHTAMPVHQVSGQTNIEPNSIYLMPPRKSMTIKAGVLLLEDIPGNDRLVLPIDHFLHSLAAEEGDKAVAIILSGTGSDGSQGARAVMEHGGQVFVQEPATCKFDGMPRNAIAAVEKAEIAPPASIPELLLQPAGTGSASIKAVKPTSPEGRILQLLRTTFRNDFSHYKNNTIRRRIERRTQLLKLDSLEEYADLVERDSDELDLLYNDLLIGVTSFFRDVRAFNTIATEVMDRLLETMSESRPIRIWVPGCATGEEAYTLAMLCHERATAEGLKPNIKVFATDLHQKSLDKGSIGRYPPDAVERMPESYRDRYLEKTDYGYTVNPEIRRFVVFSRQNLLSDPPFTRIDLVSCRNVLIYFSEAAQRRVLSLFHFALRKDGFLFLGPSESLGTFLDEFESISSRWRIYKKMRDVRLHDPSCTLPLTPADSLGMPHAEREAIVAGRGIGQRYLLPAYELLLAKHAPPSLLINRAGDLAHVFGDAKAYLHVAEGIFTQRVLDHVLPELRAPLGGIVERAWRKKTAVTARCPINRDDVKARSTVEITAEPLISGNEQAAFLLISFAPVEKGSIAPTHPQSNPLLEAFDDDDRKVMQSRIESLERDLMFTEESLQSVIEELETSNEELQATNEELMASNEELQSTNEELHSVNEELYTVSAEHQQKIDELTQLSDDMDNLLRSTEIGTIFVDRQMHIRRYTPAIGRLFNLMDHDLGRPIEHVTFRFKDDELHKDIREVARSGQVVEREVFLPDDRTYFMRILPYLDRGQERAGVVLTFMDVTPIKAAQA